MKSENLIHIKFEYESALDSKKDILASEIDLLKISQRINRYKEARLLELEIKEKIGKKLKVLKMDIGRLQNLLPKIKIPEILKPEEAHEEKKIERKKKKEKSEELSVEDELQDIQRKLNALQR